MSLISSTGETPGNYRRRKEKEASARSRTRAQEKKLKTRNKFDDQSSVDKTYSWLQNVVAEIERPFDMSRDEYLKVKYGYKD